MLGVFLLEVFFTRGAHIRCICIRLLVPEVLVSKILLLGEVVAEESNAKGVLFVEDTYAFEPNNNKS